MSITQGHALFLPEILNLVCESSPPTLWLSLMVVCRAMFPIVASHVWESLDGANNLTALLELEKDSEQSAPTVDFTRFDIYAPFVKHMTVYGRTSQYFQGELRKQALLRAQREPLLPKLVSMTMLTSDLQHDADSFIWMELFLSPSVATVNLVPNSPSGSARLSYPATRLLIQRLATSSPNIKRFVAYPGDTAKDAYADDEAADPLHVLWTPHARQSVASLAHLRDITSSIMLIDGAGLVALGQLPRLERLTMYGSDREYPKEIELYAPEDSFPSLVDLSLLKIDPVTMNALMSVEPFVRRLTSLSLGQTFQTMEYSLIPQQYEWLAQTMPRVLKHTLALKRFTYDAGTYSPYVHRGAYNIGRTSLLEFMSPLPLEYVSLSGLQFSDDLFMQSMGSAWPKLKELRIPDQRTSWDKIHWFTRIPQLGRLALLLSFASLPQSWSSSNSPLEILENTTDGYEINRIVGADQAASFLVALWPNLKQTVWTYRDEIKPNPAYSVTGKHVKQYQRFMDRVIQLVRATHASRMGRNRGGV